MLLQFNFKNFKSFRDDTTLDLTAAKISEHDEHIVSVGNERLLPLAALFGANAGGKSNALEAFQYMASYVLLSLRYGGEAKRESSEFMRPTPFLFDAKSRDAESSFEVYFILPEDKSARTYNYGFTVNQDGVREEWLNSRAKSPNSKNRVVFYRDGKTLEMPGIKTAAAENLRIALEKETLLVSLGAKLKVAELRRVQDWFRGCEVADFGHPAINYFLSEQLPGGFVEDESVQQSIVKFFSAFDRSIIGFDVEPVEKEGEKTTKVRIGAVHRMNDSGGTAVIPLKQESAGTLKMFALYPLLQSILKAGGVLLVDELNARLHPLLVRTFILLFLNPETNPRHAQLIFTSHDPWLFNSGILRRDEIWFAEKDESGVSTLYSLADFVDEGGTKIRKDADYEKNYLLGRYGAIPTMQFFDMGQGE